MKTRWAFALVGLIALSPLATPVASAQLGPRRPPQYGPGYRPQLSPYLNLIRGGDQAANYFLGVQPEQRRRADAYDFRTAITDLEVKSSQVLETGLPAVAFDNRGTFFNNTTGYFPRTTAGQQRTAPGQLPPSPRRR